MSAHRTALSSGVAPLPLHVLDALELGREMVVGELMGVDHRERREGQALRAAMPFLPARTPSLALLELRLAECGPWHYDL